VFSVLNPMPTVDSAAAARGPWRGQAALRREAGAQATRRAAGDHCDAPVYGPWPAGSMRGRDGHGYTRELAPCAGACSRSTVLLGSLAEVEVVGALDA
jgi:hypothetical protein